MEEEKKEGADLKVDINADKGKDGETEQQLPKPNIKFVGKEDYTVIENGEEVKKTRYLEPPKHFYNGMNKKTTLPSAKDQMQPFYHKDASTIIALFPKLYKPVEDK